MSVSTNIKKIMLLSAISLAITTSSYADSIVKDITSSATGMALETLKGVGEGIDEHFVAKFEIDPKTDLEALGIDISNIKNKELGTNKIAAYVIANKEFKGKIIIKAMNSGDKEIGRAITELTLEEDDAQDVIFQFSEHMDSALVKKYIVSAK
ncbi:hypothetical protein [Thorsellia anophelis]|uniref:DUF4252 domain-containing protein n=1 Tax=Thorsellia anophelis DSM 18579 TaxID=1123402 RepID=A0A1H9Y2Q3_9GAMM|nr:hypothetical protein [Thorsellia anophelis]SES62933.1 hypothetical protein SAMN02583745_00008 [Thorsellia anophelis DSM 18579]